MVSVESRVDGWRTAFVARDTRTGAEVCALNCPQAQAATGARELRATISLHRLPDATVLLKTDSGMFGTLVALRFWAHPDGLEVHFLVSEPCPRRWRKGAPVALIDPPPW